MNAARSTSDAKLTSCVSSSGEASSLAGGTITECPPLFDTLNSSEGQNIPNHKYNGGNIQSQQLRTSPLNVSQQSENDQQILPSNDLGILSESEINSNNPTGDIFSGDEEGAASLFSFELPEIQRSIPLWLQNILRKKHDPKDLMESSGGVPFPSVNIAESNLKGDFIIDRDVPCRCLFFTVKEMICLAISALGCTVFIVGLIALCMYLEGSKFR